MISICRRCLSPDGSITCRPRALEPSSTNSTKHRRTCCCCLPTHSLDPCLWEGGVLSSIFWSTSQLISPSGQQLHHSSGVCPHIQECSVVRMWVQLKRWCVSCVWVLQRGHSDDGCDLASTLCNYDLKKGDWFVLNWARVRRVRRGSISSELVEVCAVFWYCLLWLDA